MKQAEQSERSGESKLRGTTLEWIVAAVSAAIVAAMIGFVFFQAFQKADTYADPVAVVKSVTPVSDGYRVEISAQNRGGATAANVKFRAGLQSGGRNIETAEVTFSYLPSHSRRQGVLIFANDPRAYSIGLQAVSYTAP